MAAMDIVGQIVRMPNIQKVCRMPFPMHTITIGPCTRTWSGRNRRIRMLARRCPVRGTDNLRNRSYAPCMCICIYLHKYVHNRFFSLLYPLTLLYVFIYDNLGNCSYTPCMWICVYLHKYIHNRFFSLLYPLTFLYVFIYVFTYIHTCIHMCTHTHKDPNIYVYRYIQITDN